jgi:DNA-directed RNA polymerase subunit E'/Rpb7
MNFKYHSEQLLTTSINIEPQKIKGDINNLLLYTIKKRYEGVCNKDGYILKNSIDILNRSIGHSKIIDNKPYIMYDITYKAKIISPSIGDEVECIVNSNNKMGLIGFIKTDKDDTINDSPYIIIIPKEYFDNEDASSSIKVNDSMKVSIVNFRIKYMSKQIQIVAKPL